jgi:type IV pilus assembly protein PilM
MASSNICWGIEVGAGAIKALKLEAGENPRVLDFAIVPHKKVLSTPGLDQNDAIRVALGEFVNQFDLSKAAIAMSVPGHQAFARFAKLPPVEPKKVPDIVKFEAVQQIPFPIEQVEWDYQTFASPDSPEVEVGIFAITRERIMEKLTLYEDVDIVPDLVTLSPVAAYNALAFDLSFTEQTPGTILLDIGTTSTDLVIAEAGRVWVRTFPIGGHHFTEALVNAFQLSYPKAEKLKREAENTKHARHVFQAMRPVFGDLAQDVQRSIGYYQSLHKDANLTRLIGVGSTFRLPGLRKFLKQQLQLDVYRLEQFKRLTLEGPRAGEFQAETLNLATAYGLALQGLGMAALEANLMPKEVVRTAVWSRKVKWFGLAAGVAGIAGAAMFYRPFIDSVEIGSNPVPREVTSVITKVAQLKTEAADVTAAPATDQKVTDILGLLEKRNIYANIVNDVGLIVKDGQEKAEKLPAPTSGPKPVGPTFVVKDLKTRFLAQGAEASDGSGVVSTDTSGGASASPRVHIEMTVSTTQPEAQKFMLTTIEAWLKANAKRANVPYDLAMAPTPWSIVSTVEIAANGDQQALANTPEGAASQPSNLGLPPQGGRPGDRPPPVRGGKGGRGGPVGDGGGSIGDDGSSSTMVPQSALQPGGLAPSPEALNSAALEKLKQLAPLPMEPKPPAGTRITTFLVKWDALLVKQEPAKDAEKPGDAKPGDAKPSGAKPAGGGA